MTEEPKESPILGDANAALRKVASWLFIVGASLLALVVLGAVAVMGTRFPDYYHVSITHFPAVVGLPMAGIAALFIVLTCEVLNRDKLKFSLLGLKFEGASGQVVLWILCFLSITLAISLLWNKTFKEEGSRVGQQTVERSPQ